MRFCYNCGTTLNLGDLFCGNCGVKLSDGTPKDSADQQKMGIIFTNSEALAKKFGVARSEVTALLGNYIEKMRDAGASPVDYELIDSSCYTYLNPETPHYARAIHLNSSDGWLPHSYVLSDYYVHGLGEAERKPTFLFIIGSDDIIPMPRIENYYYCFGKERGEEYADTDIETDIPYSYLLGEKTYDLLCSTEIYRYDPFFHVGRLPLGTDADMDMLACYLERAAGVADTGLYISRAYAQSDIHWRSVSAAVTRSLGKKEMFPRYAQDPASGIYRKPVFTTPDVDLELLGNVFDREAGLYYFNMHGSGYPGNSCFMGVTPGTDHKAIPGMSPEYIGCAENYNIFVTEACYGAKHTGYKTGHSMLLSALSGNTILYLGSSRIAWGAVDKGYDEQDTIPLNNADSFCWCFMETMTDQLTAGESLYAARRQYFVNYKQLSPTQSLTIAEFNLFGDPTLRVCTPGAESRNKKGGEKIEPMITANAKWGFKTRLVSEKDSPSMLQMVRGAVNKTLSDIRETVNRHLYDYFGVEARSLDFIMKVEYADGTVEYEFIYDTTKGGVPERYIVVVDTSDRIKQVITSK